MDVEKMSLPCCQLCGAEEQTVREAGFQVCSSCCTVVETLKKHPSLIDKILPYIQDEQSSQAALKKKTDPELPEVLDGKRYRAIDRDQNTWYLSVSEVEGQPVEIFASTAFDRDHELQSRISNLTTITRLISLILRHIFLNEKLTLEKCLKQIQRSSRNKNDLPDMLYRVLSRYVKIR
ncbi:TFIIB-type zinc ribbon-containing protein [Candidatus Electrothrix aarhusensis]